MRRLAMIPAVLTGPGCLRLLLSLTVFVHHASRLGFGSWAVYVFYILSGYWIARMYEQKYARGNAPYWTYLESRYLRVWPIYAIGLVIAIGIALAGLGEDAAKTWAAITNPIWLARAAIIVTCGSQFLPLGPAWSLDIEFQFYLVAPLMVLAGRRLGSVMTVALIGIFFLAFAFGAARKPTDHSATRLLSDYLAFFMTGIMIYQSDWKPGPRTAYGSLALFAMVVLILLASGNLRGVILGGSRQGPMFVRYNNLASGIGALVFAPYVAYVVRRPSTPLDIHLGNLAFPIYLIHYPIHLAVTHWEAVGLGRLVGLLLKFLITMALSLGIYVGVDVPIESWRKRLVARKLNSAAR